MDFLSGAHVAQAAMQPGSLILNHIEQPRASVGRPRLFVLEMKSKENQSRENPDHKRLPIASAICLKWIISICDLFRRNPDTRQSNEIHRQTVRRSYYLPRIPHAP